ncbi:FAD-binding oxidoreductase [Actinocrispum wychmicini]|uniref:Glycolate oxidase n=1 Tax=Actinocrispum wychmicini TaxID=1213861 RepID=A0A4R2IY94_9PSEU|nr:FAD-binding oxidoreductase [Actinocrispum wychmicini]TCO50921.1 glycolate oxidase [Actinocrispum wychmicini]
MADIGTLLSEIVGVEHVLAGDAISEDYAHDEALSRDPVKPAYVVRPETAEQVARILKAASDQGVSVTARGSGSGLSGASVPLANGVLISFERMNAILEIDTENHVAVVQPGVTLQELDAKTAEHGLVYTVYPGELSASLGGNVGTNAGGMRAVKYGVTRHNVLGLEAALPTGELIRTGGKYVKASTGYDLTQLIIGSEGTLALVTEAVLKLHPRLPHQGTVLAPFTDLDEVARAVPKVVGSGLGPLIVEYIDGLTMGAITYSSQLKLGIPADVRDTSHAYLVVMLENRTQDRLGEDIEELGELLGGLGAKDVYVLDGPSARKLIDAREKAFFTAKAAGADDIIDTVIPRASLPEFMARTREIAQENNTFVIGCGHAGDGNVHLAVLQKDPEVRARVLRALFEAGIGLGGAISGEHGIGRKHVQSFVELTDPTTVDLMRRIKTAFDPAGILNPGVLF